MDTLKVGVEPEKVRLQVHGAASQPTLVYLPGLHGNWTLIAGFRKALAGRVRLVQAWYPASLKWSLEDYAAGVEAALTEQGITGGWLLGESFGSQVVWPILARKQFQVEGLILAGGFVRHPIRWGVRFAERMSGDISLSIITRILFGYAKVARWRFRNSPETLSGINEFIAHLTENDRKAAKHRLHLIAENDPCTVAQGVTVPFYAITGLFDPVVPWYWVRRWLKKNCANLREYKIIPHADHNVLGTGSIAAADQIVQWMGQSH